MARPRTVSDEEILDKARELFLEHGFGASTNRIAEAVGLSGPALFKRFGTKERMFVRALAPGSPPAWVVNCLAGPDDRSIDVQLLEVAREMHAFFEENAARFAVLRTSPCMTKVFDHYEVPPPVAAFQVLTRWFGQAIDAGLIRPMEPAIAAEMFMAAVAWRKHFRIMLGPMAPEFHGDDGAYLAEMVQTLMRGLRVVGAP